MILLVSNSGDIYNNNTFYNKTLIYKQQMKGKAEIITKDISVLDRIFINFKKLMDKR